MAVLDPGELRELLRARIALRGYLRWMDEQAHAVGLTPARLELLLTVVGHPDPAGPTVSDVAETLLLRHHSAVGLIDRAAEAGLVERAADPGRHRFVRVRLTAAGEAALAALASRHRDELGRLRDHLALLEALPQGDPPPPPPRPSPEPRRRPSPPAGGPRPPGRR